MSTSTPKPTNGNRPQIPWPVQTRTFPSTPKVTASPRQPIIYITPSAKARLDLYIRLAQGEISGLGFVTRLGSRDFLIQAVYLLQQECSYGSTDLDPDDLARFLIEFIAAGHDPAGIKLWWHSHARMAPFWSSTDEATIEGFNNQWMISIVGNQNGLYLARLDIYEPVRVAVDNLTLQVRHPIDSRLREEVQREIRAKVNFIPDQPTQPGEYYTLLPPPSLASPSFPGSTKTEQEPEND